jgi:hypothetical protein
LVTRAPGSHCSRVEARFAGESLVQPDEAGLVLSGRVPIVSSESFPP